MDSELEKRPVKKKKKRLVASSLNFSRNNIGDPGAQQLVDYLLSRNISVQILKLSRNDIGDDGAFAIGQFIARSREPVHEIYLNHNCISEKGACSIMESITRSEKFPYTAGSGKRDPDGQSPVWLRLENNCIKWRVIDHRLNHSRMRWCASDSREGWLPKERAPMMCLHNSYMNQDGEIHEVPMYIFPDASALRWMLLEEDKLFCFKGLFNLCRQGNMKCNAQGNDPDLKEEMDRIVVALTDGVLGELQENADKNPEEQQRAKHFLSAQDSYLELGHGLGILEALETCGHNRLMKLLPRHAQMATEMHVLDGAVKLFDFACLWASQISSDGRVLFLTADAAVAKFGAELGSDAELHASAAGIPLVTLHVDELERIFSADSGHGCCQQLCAAASDPSAVSCAAPLSASLVTAVVDIPAMLRRFGGNRDAVAVEAPCRSSASNGSDIDTMRKELREAVALFGTAQKLLNDAEASSLLERIDVAQKKWQSLLNGAARGAAPPKQVAQWQ